MTLKKEHTRVSVALPSGYTRLDRYGERTGLITIGHNILGLSSILHHSVASKMKNTVQAQSISHSTSLQGNNN